MVLMLIPVIIGSALVVVRAIRDYNHTKSRQVLDKSLSRHVATITNFVENGASWGHSVDGSTSTLSDMDCLRDNSDCSGAGGPFILFDTEGNAFVRDHQLVGPGSGLTFEGWTCDDPDPNAGNIGCPIGLNLSWSAICQGTSCENPLIQVEVSFFFNPGSRFHNFPVNLNNYHTLIMRGTRTARRAEGFSFSYVETDEEGEGPCSTTGWTQRNLPNSAAFDDGNNIVAMGGNTFTLRPGTYSCRIHAPAFAVGTFRTRLVTSDGAVVIEGTDGHAYWSTQTSLASGVFTIHENKTLSVEQTCESQPSDFGFSDTYAMGYPLEDLPGSFQTVMTSVQCERFL